VQEVSIIPRGGAAGYTLTRPETDNNHVLKSYLDSELIMCMGGRAAESIIFGDISTGAVGDIKQATDIATKMVTEWGMSSLGPINYRSGDEMFLGRDYLTKSSVSEEMSSKIDAEVSKKLNACLDEAVSVLKKNRSIMDEMVKLLFERETIYADEIDMLMAGKTCADVLKVIKEKEVKAEAQRKADLKKENEEKEKAIELEKREKEKENRKRAEEALEFLNKNGIITASLDDGPIIEANAEETKTTKTENDSKENNAQTSKKKTTAKNVNKEKDSETK